MPKGLRPVAARIALGAVFVATGLAFDKAVDGLPYAPLFWLIYYAGAATVDLLMFRITRYFVSGQIQRDVEAICIASIITNALGWALRLADTPPDFYNCLIAGLNYVLAIRLLLGDGDVSDLLDRCHRGLVVLRHLHRHPHHTSKEEKR